MIGKKPTLEAMQGDLIRELTSLYRRYRSRGMPGAMILGSIYALGIQITASNGFRRMMRQPSGNDGKVVEWRTYER